MVICFFNSLNLLLNDNHIFCFLAEQRIEETTCKGGLIQIYDECANGSEVVEAKKLGKVLSLYILNLFCVYISNPHRNIGYLSIIYCN